MPGTRIYVGGLTYDTSARDLERFFRSCGKINEVLLKKGYGFVEFDDHRDAEDAVYELNGKRLLGRRISIEMARGNPRGRDRFASRKVRTGYRLIVENLSSRVSWQDLKDHMRQAGEVTYADAHKMRANEGVVEFASLADMKNALDRLDETEINGRRIRLIETNRRERSRSRSFRSRSRSRTRSTRKLSSRSGSKSRSRSRPRSPPQEDRDRMSSRSGYKSRSRSRPRSPPQEDRDRRMSMSPSHFKPRSPSKSISRSRTRSRSRSQNGNIQSREMSEDRYERRSSERRTSAEPRNPSQLADEFNPFD